MTLFGSFTHPLNRFLTFVRVAPEPSALMYTFFTLLIIGVGMTPHIASFPGATSKLMRLGSLPRVDHLRGGARSTFS